MPFSPKPSVLHVLPYPGGGGETYVNQLNGMPDYQFETTYIASGPFRSPAVLAGAVRAQLARRRYDLLHVHGEVAAGLCQPTLALRPSVLTLHGLHLVRRLTGRRRKLAVANLRLLVRGASRTICVGDAEFVEVESLVGATERLVLIRNGVDPVAVVTPEERATARAALGLSASDTVGLYLAALEPHKEPVLVAHAALDVANKGLPFVLLLAGDGPLRGELDALADGSRALRVLGYQSDVDRVFAAADIFVLPSRREGLSFALLEAMSRGLTPIVSDAPGNPEAVGEAGIVVRQNDIEGFRYQFERLTIDRAERELLSERARLRAATRFSKAEMVEGTRAVYEDVLSSSGHGRTETK
jgi:glycosyltransferase involved in cell wall biosynthesis